MTSRLTICWASATWLSGRLARVLDRGYTRRLVLASATVSALVLAAQSWI